MTETFSIPRKAHEQTVGGAKTWEVTSTQPLQFFRDSRTTTHECPGDKFPGHIYISLGIADNYLKGNWSLLNPEGREGKGGATIDVCGDEAGSSHTTASGGAQPRFRYSGPRTGPSPLWTPTNVRAPPASVETVRLLSEVPLQVPLPFCLSTSALGRQYGCCGCLAKRTLIRGRGVPSKPQLSRFPAPPSPPLPPPFAPVLGAGGLLTTWGRASASSAGLPVQRRSGGRRRTRLVPASARWASAPEALGPQRQARPGVAMAPVQLENHQLVPPGGGGGGSGGPASAPAPPPPGAAVAAAAAAAASPGYRLSTLIEFLLHRAYSELMVLTDL